jgi:hypothetical protein
MSGRSDAPLEGVVLDDVEPESIASTELRAALTSERSLVRQRGARVCAALAADNVDEVRPFVKELGAVVHDENAGVVQTATAALQEIATIDSTALVPIVDDLATLVGSDLPSVRLAGARLLGEVAEERPAACVSVFGTLLGGLSESPVTAGGDSAVAYVEDPGTKEAIQQREQESKEYEQHARQLASNVVITAANAEPAAVADHTATLADLATANDAVARSAALDALGSVARASPEAVRPHVSVALTALDADARLVRARAVRLLGLLSDEAHIDALERVAASDPNEEIATFAAETASFLAR